MLNPPVEHPPSSKRKAEGTDGASKRKRPKSTAEHGQSSSTPHSKVSITLKLGPKPPEPEAFPCCLCVSMSHDGLLYVQDPPTGKRELPESLSSIREPAKWMAHEECAKVVPETWVDTVELAYVLPDGSHAQASRVFGVDAVVKDRWNLVGHHIFYVNFSVTTRSRNVPPATRDDKRHMAPLSNAPRENVLNHSTCPAREKDKVVLPTQCCVKLRRR